MSYFRREYRYITYTQQLVCMQQQVALQEVKRRFTSQVVPLAY